MAKSRPMLMITCTLSIFGNGPVFAAGQFTPASDLAGLTLTMSKT